MILTIADLLSIFAIVFVIYIVVAIVRILWNKNVFIRSLMARFTDNAMIALIFFGYNKIVFTSHMNLKHIVFVDAETTLSVMLAIVSCVFTYILTGYIAV